VKSKPNIHAVLNQSCSLYKIQDFDVLALELTPAAHCILHDKTDLRLHGEKKRPLLFLMSMQFVNSMFQILCAAAERNKTK